jgi:antitoxin component YwqK of YwqJK toxin-antitoxin module
MKLRSALFILIILVGSSCRQKETVVESTFPDGSPKRVCTYLGKGRNKEMIKEILYYKNKKVNVEGEYRHAKRNGKWVYYYESGLVWSEGFFRNGKNDGRRMTYYPNGKVRYEAWYRNDKKVGIWKFYDETGKLVKSVNFSKTTENQ